jgi:SAM-dependent methyltransferase
MSNKKENSWDSIWDNVFTSQEWGKYPSESLIQFVARNYYKLNRSEVKILEVGCGTGANLWYISREGFQAYGMDGSEIAIGMAKSRMSKEQLSINVEVGDILNLPYQDNFFDAVIDNECVYCNNFENSIKIIAEIHRVLKRKGKFYSRTFAEQMYIGKRNDSEKIMEFSNVEDGPLKGKGFVRLSSEDSIKKLYGKQFTIESIDYLEYTRDNQAYTIYYH